MEKMQYKCGSENGRDFFVVAGYTKNASDRSVAWHVAPGGDAELSSCCTKIEYEQFEVEGFGEFNKFAMEVACLTLPADAVLRGGKGRGRGSETEETAQLLRPRFRGEVAASSLREDPAKEAADEQTKVARWLAKHLLC